MKKIVLCVLLVCVSMTSFAEEEPRDVRWYLENAQALTEKISECNNDPGRLGNTPNCINARQAAHYYPMYAARKAATDALVYATQAVPLILENFINNRPLNTGWENTSDEFEAQINPENGIIEIKFLRENGGKLDSAYYLVPHSTSGEALSLGMEVDDINWSCSTTLPPNVYDYVVPECRHPAKSITIRR